MTAPKSKNRKQVTYVAGKRAEWLAMVYLMVKGYWPLAWRYKCPVGEIDLILAHRKQIIFAEVKFRAQREVAAHAITPQQQFRIARAARFWLSKHRHRATGNMRFDVILLAPWRWPTHIRGAFLDNNLS